MSQKLIHFLYIFLICFFYIITCFYSEILEFYQIHILQTFTEEMAVLASIQKLYLVK